MAVFLGSSAFYNRNFLFSQLENYMALLNLYLKVFVQISPFIFVKREILSSYKYENSEQLALRRSKYTVKHGSPFCT